jgi:hypothetical protein
MKKKNKKVIGILQIAKKIKDEDREKWDKHIEEEKPADVERTLKSIVIEVLEKDVQARNSDNWLIYCVLRYYTPIYIPPEDFHQLPAFESIKRCRATIQNEEHKFPPTDKDVMDRRGLKAEDFLQIPKNQKTLKEFN